MNENHDERGRFSTKEGQLAAISEAKRGSLLGFVNHEGSVRPAQYTKQAARMQVKLGTVSEMKWMDEERTRLTFKVSGTPIKVGGR